MLGDKQQKNVRFCDTPLMHQWIQHADHHDATDVVAVAVVVVIAAPFVAVAAAVAIVCCIVVITIHYKL